MTQGIRLDSPSNLFFQHQQTRSQEVERALEYVLNKTVSGFTIQHHTRQDNKLIFHVVVDITSTDLRTQRLIESVTGRLIFKASRTPGDSTIEFQFTCCNNTRGPYPFNM